MNTFNYFSTGNTLISYKFMTRGMDVGLTFHYTLYKAVVCAFEYMVALGCLKSIWNVCWIVAVSGITESLHPDWYRATWLVNRRLYLSSFWPEWEKWNSRQAIATSPFYFAQSWIAKDITDWVDNQRQWACSHSGPGRLMGLLGVGRLTNSVHGFARIRAKSGTEEWERGISETPLSRTFYSPAVPRPPSFLLPPLSAFCTAQKFHMRNFSLFLPELPYH